MTTETVKPITTQIFSSLTNNGYSFDTNIKILQLMLLSPTLYKEFAAVVANSITTCTSADDVLVAQARNQTLTGNGGNDQYVVTLGKGETVIDNSSTIDTAQHGKLIVGLDESNIWLSQSGDDLLVQALNSSDLVNIKNWFTFLSRKAQPFRARISGNS